MSQHTRNCLIGGAIGALIGAAIAYLGCAFVQWDANPAHWGESSRTSAAILSIAFAPLAIATGAAAASAR